MRHMYIAALLCTVCTAQAAPLTLMTEEYAPFNFHDKRGRLTGLSTEIVRTMMEQARIPYTMELMPWMRAVTLAESTPNHCVFSTSRIAERETRFHWIGPLASNDWTLWALAPVANPPASIYEVKGKRVGSYLGDGGVEYLERRGIEVDAAPRDSLNPRKLQMKRIDYWAAGAFSARYMMDRQGIHDVVPVMVIEKVLMYLACHPSLSRDTVDFLNRTMAAMEKDGTAHRIRAKYGYKP